MKQDLKALSLSVFNCLKRVFTRVVPTRLLHLSCIVNNVVSLTCLFTYRMNKESFTDIVLTFSESSSLNDSASLSFKDMKYFFFASKNRMYSFSLAAYCTG